MSILNKGNGKQFLSSKPSHLQSGDVGPQGSASTAPAAAPVASPPKASSKPATFLSRGKETLKKLEQNKAEAEVRRAERESGVFRFWLPAGSSAMVTFLDGGLDSDGDLDMFSIREHNVKINGKWGNHYLCTADNEEPCPLCMEGNRAYFAGLLTILDHRSFEGQGGKVYKDTKKLLVPKLSSIEMLRQYAKKRGGLAGCTFEVTRSNKDEVSIGNIYDFESKTSLEQLAKAYKDVEPIDYSKALVYRSAEELRALGFGTNVVGAEAPSTASPDEDISVENEL